jgi:cytochrome P450
VEISRQGRRAARTRARDGDDRLDENELISLVFLLLWAGYETTVDLIGNGLRLILSDPEVRAGLLTGRQAVPDVVEEVLRFDSPAILGIRRFATKDLEVGGEVIPAGSTVMVSVAAANHDPARFESPDNFMPGSRDHSHLSFGYGIHHCLGAPLAWLEGRIAINAALHRYPAMQLGVPATDLQWRPSIRSHGLRSLPVLLKP